MSHDLFSLILKWVGPVFFSSYKSGTSPFSPWAAPQPRNSGSFIKRAKVSKLAHCTVVFTRKII